MKTLTILKPFDPSKPVWVYRNLTRNLFSVMQGGLVVAHAERLYLKDVRFHIRHYGRRKVIRTGQKNVHAFIIGHLCDVAEIRLVEQKHLKGENDILPYFGVTYNPKRDDCFMNEDRDAEIKTADFVDLDMDCTMKVMAVFKPETAAAQWPSRTF